MGADEVIDYTQQDVLHSEGCYDIFFDVVSNKSFAQAKPTLKPAGIYVRTLPSFETLILGPLINPFRAKKSKIMDCKASAKDLTIVKEMVENGKLAPLIEKVYPLEQVQEAHTRSETGRVVSKLVLKVV
jgi:NADPH:quinone reductase-like Zn-dependent oxidoreductase